MDIKYNVSKYKDSKLQEIKDSISVDRFEVSIIILFHSKLIRTSNLLEIKLRSF